MATKKAAKTKKAKAPKKGMTVSYNKDEKTLEISMPIQERISKSGKNVVIASTGGNKDTGIDYKGKSIVIGVNAYVGRDEE